MPIGRGIHISRLRKAIEICELSDADLSALAKKTKVLISTVGPYAIYKEQEIRRICKSQWSYHDSSNWNRELSSRLGYMVARVDDSREVLCASDEVMVSVHELK